MREARVKITKEWLYEKYINERLSAQKISKLVGCSKTTILRKLSKFEIEKRDLVESHKGLKPSAETREKMSKSHSGKIRTEDHKKELSKSLKKTFSDPEKKKEILKKASLTRIKNGNMKLILGKPAREWSEEKSCSISLVHQLYNKYGEDFLLEYDKKSGTLIEQKIENLLQEKGIRYEKQREVVTEGSLFVPDFFLSDYNIIIECDGLWYHCDKHPKFSRVGRQYHQNKKLAYKRSGYDSLFFREDEIHNKIEIISSLIDNKTKNCQRVYARSCKLSTELGSFFEENHLMGVGSGRIYSLKFGGDSKCAIQVRWKSVDRKILEVSRFCTKKGWSVVGGWSRLIKHAIRKEEPSKIITFIDRRYGSGEYLDRLGWNKESEHLSFGWVDLNKKRVFHRMNFLGNSGYDHGFAKIWDCGQVKWSKVCE